MKRRGQMGATTVLRPSPVPLFAHAVVAALLMFGLCGCDGGVVTSAAIPALSKYLGAWVVQNTPGLGLEIKPKGQATALVKQWLDTKLEDVGHATLREDGLLDIVFTSVKNGGRVDGLMHATDDLATLLVDMVDSGRVVYHLVKDNADS